jgi:quinol-cytochrome oxidoreductase complex cytochrome b subunit
VDNPTLTRFFALHFLMPFMIAGVAMLHLVALHQHGSNNPLGIDIKAKKDTIPFHPYYTIKDLFGLGAFLILFAAFVFFAPDYLGHPDNYIQANPMVTPPHIVPEWYFLPFYAILRAVTFDIGAFGVVLIDAKLGGVLAMGGAVMVLFILPWLDTHPVRSSRFRPIHKQLFWLFVVNCVFLGWIGSQPAEGIYVVLGQISTLLYFAYFFVALPLLSRFEPRLPLPASIADPIVVKSTSAAV